MSETGVVKGFKVFNPNWTCKGKAYTCPGKFEEDVISTAQKCQKGGSGLIPRMSGGTALLLESLCVTESSASLLTTV